MIIADLLNNKPVLVGFHLGFAILGIDLLLWLIGEVVAGVRNNRRTKWVGLGAVGAFTLSWLFGGYYYVKFYGPLVKPIIKASATPWAHAVVMEAKEHMFLFILPMVLTVSFLAFADLGQLKGNKLTKPFMYLTAATAGIALTIGLMGFIISAAARWA